MSEENKTVKIALAGNPNCGKTTLFNALTGANQYVGNWPGVTVEKKEGRLKGHKEIYIMDLPGIYSLSPYTLEEVVSRNYLVNEKPDVILNIVDGTNIERNLYLTTQLMELGIPVVVAVNMMDIVKKTGDKIDIARLSKILGCKVVSISALKGDGIMEAAKLAAEEGRAGKDMIPLHKFSHEAEGYLEEIIERMSGIPKAQERFFAIKLFEGDEKIQEFGRQLPDVDDIVKKAEKDLDDDSESIITGERYNYIGTVIEKCYKRAGKEKLTTSDKIDKLVTNRFLALPIFAIIMFIVYYISVTTVGTWATDWANDGVFGDGWSLFGIVDVPGIPSVVEGWLEALGTADWLNGLILDGIIAGVGAVLGFVPQMLILFIFLAFLEGCGYMARVAFIMDRIFRKFGLSGKSFIPMLIGTGCGVPGIMASRTIENDRDRKMTIMTTTFIPCGAKLPIIALIAGALFNNAGWVAVSAYFIGVAAIIISGIILKKTRVFAGEPAPFVMELPAYHMPTVGNVLRSMWERGWSFIKRAGTIILLSTIILWFLQGYGFTGGSFGAVEELDDSLLAKIGNAFAWIFTPLGWGEWKAAVATVTGLIAKEEVVSTFGVLFHVDGDVAEDTPGLLTALGAYFVPIAAYSFLVFNLLCAPCFAAMGAIKREMNNWRWTLFAIGYQCVLAYIVSMCVFQIGSLIIDGSFGIGTVVSFLFVIAFIYLLARPEPKGNLNISGKRAVDAA